VTNQAKILVVDDDVGILDTLSDILSDMGYDVAVANSGIQGIKQVIACPYDLILMDIKMPSMNGVTAYKAMKKLRPDAAVIMMTAYSVESLIDEALNEGAYGIMYKPIDIAKVVTVIQRLKESMGILIVDDDFSTCVTMMDVLHEKGYTAITARNGEEAINLVRDSDFDLIFVDVKMPDMNGLEVFLAIQRMKPTIKVIMMTGYRCEVQDLVTHAIEHQAYACIYKPFEVETVLTIIDDVKRLNFQREVT
jgi:two-component system response regulator HydG